jgi:hypothetical protein
VGRLWRPLALPGARSCDVGVGSTQAAPLGSKPCQRSYSVASVTFQYASLMNFDQLTIRTEGDA